MGNGTQQHPLLLLLALDLLHMGLHRLRHAVKAFGKRTKLVPPSDADAFAVISFGDCFCAGFQILDWPQGTADHPEENRKPDQKQAGSKDRADHGPSV